MSGSTLVAKDGGQGGIIQQEEQVPRNSPNLYVSTWPALLRAAVCVWPLHLAKLGAELLKAVFRFSFKAGWQLLRSLLEFHIRLRR